MDYTPSSEPTADDLQQFGRVQEGLTSDDRQRWAAVSRQFDVVLQMAEHIGLIAEIHGDLHVLGDFNLCKHGLSGLWITGNLIVDGVYEDQAYPQSLVLIEGNLRARNIITGALLEVHGDVETEHLAGDYNDFGAMFCGATRATTFFPEQHHFEFLGDVDVALEFSQNNEHSLSLYATSFIQPAFVNAYGEPRKQLLLTALAQGEDILLADPRDPLSVSEVNLSERELHSLPASLFTFIQLKSLNLAYNNIQRLDGLTRLPLLNKLCIAGNPLAVFSEELLQIPLREFNVGDCVEFPDWFSRLESLAVLKITVEELHTLPEVISRIPNLRDLQLADWPETWEPLLANVASLLPRLNLRQLSMTGGKISQLPKDLTAFAALERLDLSEQAFEEVEQRRITTALLDVVVCF